MKFSFIVSFLFHSLLIGLIISSPTLIWSSDITDLEGIEVSFVVLEETASKPTQPETKLIPLKPSTTVEEFVGEAESSEIKNATTVVAEFNPSNLPSKRNDDLPETMIAPPKKLASPSLAIRPKKQDRVTPPKKKSTPIEQPSSDKSESFKQQPEAALPQKRPKQPLSLESVLKSIKQRNNDKLSSKRNQKSSAPQKQSATDKVTISPSSSPAKHSKSPTKTTKPKLSRADLLRLSNQLSSCWTIVSSDRAINHTIRIRIGFDDNFHVNQLEFLDGTEKDHIPSYRVAAEQAQSAIMNPSCQPLALPKNKISASDKLILNFNPQVMMGSFQ